MVLSLQKQVSRARMPAMAASRSAHLQCADPDSSARPAATQASRTRPPSSRTSHRSRGNLTGAGSRVECLDSEQNLEQTGQVRSDAERQKRDDTRPFYSIVRHLRRTHPAKTAGSGLPREGGGTRRVLVVRQAAWARAEAGRLIFQFQGSNSSRRFEGWSCSRARTSASQACGSTSLSLAVSISV